MATQSLARNQARAQFRQLPFRLTRKQTVKVLRNNELEDGITEELQPLIIEMMPLRFVAEAGMRERFRKEERIPKFVADAFFQRVHRC